MIRMDLKKNKFLFFCFWFVACWKCKSKESCPFYLVRFSVFLIADKKCRLFLFFSTTNNQTNEITNEKKTACNFSIQINDGQDHHHWMSMMIETLLNEMKCKPDFSPKNKSSLKYDHRKKRKTKKILILVIRISSLSNVCFQSYLLTAHTHTHTL